MDNFFQVSTDLHFSISFNYLHISLLLFAGTQTTAPTPAFSTTPAEWKTYRGWTTRCSTPRSCGPTGTPKTTREWKGRRPGSLVVRSGIQLRSSGSGCSTTVKMSWRLRMKCQIRTKSRSLSAPITGFTRCDNFAGYWQIHWHLNPTQMSIITTWLLWWNILQLRNSK